MRHLEVLVLTNSTTIPRILNWKVSVVQTTEIAIEQLQQRPYKVVAISKEISDIDKLKLSTLMPVLFSDVVLVEYTTEATIAETVKTAYWSKNKPARSSNYLDNSFEIKLANSINLNS